MNEMKLILVIGKYDIYEFNKNSLFIKKSGEEGMQVSLDKFEALLDQFWNDSF